MPWPRAHWYMLIVVAVTVFGFWESYFSSVAEGPWQFHAHGMAAGLWVLLVTAQSWTAQRSMLTWHAAAGRASLFLFPFLIGGLAAIMDFSAKGFVHAGGDARMAMGGAFFTGVVVAIAAYVTLFHAALKHRRDVWLDSGFLLATPVILWESPFSRLLLTQVPDLFSGVVPAIVWSLGSALAFCVIVRWRVGPNGRPFTIAAGFIVADMIAMGLTGGLAPVRAAMILVSELPSSVMVGAGMALGAATSRAGWVSGKRPRPRVAAATSLA